MHVFFGMPVTTCLADLMRIIKTNSSKWINEQNFIKEKFHWQNGYEAFSYSRSQRDHVINYIMNQEEHHKRKSFKEEYLKMLTDCDVSFTEAYLFEFYENRRY